ncbi:glycine-rich domain-containing protein [Metapseudomonas furukawaii]|uniref:glycine-rich domain-containing protein n=1 Tax=Metapseudomonas furukawaii TaxID=1149133 RepID=UPI0040457D54
MDFPHSEPGVSLTPDGHFTDGDPAAGIPASRDPASWANSVTNELLNVISAGGLQPDEFQHNQLLEAIRELIAVGAMNAIVVRPPTITASNQAPVGHPAVVKLQGKSLLLDTRISGFRYRLDKGSELDAPANASGASEIGVTVPGRVGEQRVLSVVAVDEWGNRSLATNHTFVLTGRNLPDMTLFRHTVPQQVSAGASYAVTFSGATADTGTVVYRIDPRTSGLSFSKTANIQANDQVTLTAPLIVGADIEVLFDVVAVDNAGLASSICIKALVNARKVWEFPQAGAGTWEAPVTGQYELLAIGGGGAGGTPMVVGQVRNHGGGGGAGYGERRIVQLTKGQKIAYEVGKGGSAPAQAGAVGQDGGATTLGVITVRGGQGGRPGYSAGAGSGGNGGSNGGAGKVKPYHDVQVNDRNVGGIDGAPGQGAGYYSKLDNSLTHSRPLTSAHTLVAGHGGGGVGGGSGGGAGGLGFNVGHLPLAGDYSNGADGYARIKWLSA